MRLRPALMLVVLAVVAYAPVLGAGFLNYDDPWLIEHNPYMAAGAWHTPWAAFFDLSRETRLALGAEYLPLRDCLVWLETRLFGLWAPGMHAVSVALYAAALLLLRGALVRTFGARPAVELGVVLFALHPVHAESVAWLSGQKDVLALVFVGAALYVHAGAAPRRWLWVPLLVACASLSKAMSVVVLALLAAQDLLQRRWDFRVYAGSTLAVALTLALHLHVGGRVGMLAEPAGGSLASALITMGPVWLRYIALACAPFSACIAHDVPLRTHWDGAALAGYALLALWLAHALWQLRRGARLSLFLCLWFVVPLLPVSQLVPLQHLMADRYLWLSVLAACLAYGFALESKPLWPVGAAILGGAALVLTFQRAVLFSDSTLLFTHATRHTEHDTDAPLQLAQALEHDGEPDAAMLAYRSVLSRAPRGPVPDALRAANALARLLVGRGELDEASHILHDAQARAPDDPTTRDNLAKVQRLLAARAPPQSLPSKPAP
jgi:hypothetical protein